MKTVTIGACLMLMTASAHGQESGPPIIPPQPIIQRDVLKAEAFTGRPSASDLTIEQLYSLINERDRQYQQRFESQEKAVNNALVAAKEAVNAALAAAKEAVTKAETANEKRLDSVNEFRGQLKDQAATLLPRAEGDIRFDAIDKELKRLSDAMLMSTSFAGGVQWLWIAIGSVIGGLLTLLTLGLNIRNSMVTKQPVK